MHLLTTLAQMASLQPWHQLVESSKARAALRIEAPLILPCNNADRQ
jgi:hypothetical protein